MKVGEFSRVTFVRHRGSDAVNLAWTPRFFSEVIDNQLAGQEILCQIAFESQIPQPTREMMDL
jgi:hypothetical protein